MQVETVNDFDTNAITRHNPSTMSTVTECGNDRFAIVRDKRSVFCCCLYCVAIYAGKDVHDIFETTDQTNGKAMQKSININFSPTLATSFGQIRSACHELSHFMNMS